MPLHAEACTPWFCDRREASRLLTRRLVPYTDPQVTWLLDQPQPAARRVG